MNYKSQIINKNIGKNQSFFPVSFLQNNSGFTLIETMIAVGLFTIIMTIGTGAVLNTNATYHRNQTLRTNLDSLNFVLEDMSRNMRLGRNFLCPTGTTSVTTPQPIGDYAPKDCREGAQTIAFESANGDSSKPEDNYVYVIAPNNSIYSIYKSTDGGTTFKQITDSSIDISSSESYFQVIGSSPADKVQPYVAINLMGRIRTKYGVDSFHVQTTASSRIIDR